MSTLDSSTKSTTAFRTISEVSSELDVPQHVLRFWETKFTQVRPLKRAGRRRYYRPDDIAVIRTIRDLLYKEGYTIKGVQKLFREQGSAKTVRSAATEDVSSRGVAQKGLSSAAAGDTAAAENQGAEKRPLAESATTLLSSQKSEGSESRTPEQFSTLKREEKTALLGELRQIRQLLD